MSMRLPAAPVAVAPVGLRESCDALGAALASLDTSAPEAQRYVEALTKVQAIAAKGDQTTKETLQPLVQIIQQGASGQNVTSQQGAAMLKLAMACSAAGSTLGRTPSAEPTSAAPSPSSTDNLLDTKSFKVYLKEQSRKCSGDACVASVRTSIGYVEADELTRTTVVTYGVYDGNNSISRTVTLDAGRLRRRRVHLRHHEGK